MKKISEILSASDYVMGQLAYSPKQDQGFETANGAKKTLIDELNEIEIRLNKLESSSFKDLIFSTIKKLYLCLETIDIELDCKSYPLNLILYEYFIFTREKLRKQLVEIENDITLGISFFN